MIQYLYVLDFVFICFVLFIFSLVQWSKFLELGDGIDTQVVEDKISALNPGQCASIIYTVSRASMVYVQ